MSRQTKRVRNWLILIVILGLASFTVKTIYDAGAFDKVWNHPLPNCTLRKGLRGVEDLALIPGQNRLILSAYDRKRLTNVSQDGLYVWDPSSPDRPARQLVQGPYHGISVWTEGGETRIFAILHKKDADQVQIFSFAEDRISLLREVSFPGVHTLNEVLALGPDSFFASQDLGFALPLLQKIEMYLQLKLGKIWLFDQGKLSVAVSDMQFPDGMELSPDQKRLYVGSMTGRTLMSFHHKPATHQLNLEWEKPFGTALDNFSWTPDKRLLVAAHPNLLKLDAHSQDPLHHRAPSQVLLVSGLPDQLAIEEIYSSEGLPLSASTSAVQWDRQLIMGSVFDEGFLVCDLAK